MRIAVGLFGFLGEILTTDQIRSHLQSSFPPDSKIDIFYYAPRICHESDPTLLDESVIETSYRNANLGDVHFQWFTYSPFPFIEKSISQGLPMKNTMTLMYPYRLFSMYSNFTKTLQLINDTIQKTNMQYDAIVMTRNDYIRFIAKYTDMFEDIPLKEGIYAMRNPHSVLSPECHAEDRVIYGLPHCILKLLSIESELPSILSNPTLAYGEGILKTFLLKHFQPSQLFYQRGIQFLAPCPVNFEFKRSENCKNIVQEYYYTYEKN
jgi:hypothetical protein